MKHEQRPESAGALSFSPMTPAHIAACAAIAESAPDPWRKADFTTHLALGHPAVVALDEKQAVIAFALFRPQDDAADLALVATAPAARRRQAATGLLQYSFTKLRRQGFKRLLLEVRASNKAALALYSKLGFVKLAVRKAMYSHPREDGICMELPLTENHG